MAEYKHSSPTASLISMGFIDPDSGSQSGSDYGFDAIVNGHGPLSIASQTSAPTVRNSSGMDTNVVTSPLRNGQSRTSGYIGSNGPRFNSAGHNNLVGSDTTISDGQRALANPLQDAFMNDGIEASNSVAGPSKIEASQTGTPPAWSELKTKAGKERKRLPLACIACRRKKIRCSGEKPACKHCLRSRIPCVYKVTTRKAAPRTDYMAMLDKRLKRMEERVIKIIPKEQQSVVASTGRAVVKPPLPATLPKSGGSSKKRVADQAFGDELEDWAAANQTERPDSKAKASTEQQAPGQKDNEEQTLLHEGEEKLPCKELQEHLAEVFFDYVYGQSYHLLHKPSFMRRLSQGLVPPVLMLAVCAISARFSSHPSVRTEPAFLRGEDWASAAREIALRRYDTPNITILIVYLILGLHEFGTCQGGRSWMFGGMAQRMAYALQLHKDLDHDPKDRTQQEKSELTFTDREIRRRTMWSCFLMDRFSSSGTDRPIFVSEQHIRAQLPIREKYYQMEINGPTEDLEGSVPNPVPPGEGQMADAKENMGVAAYLIRLVAIWGRLISYLNQGGKECDEHPMWSEESRFRAIKRATEDWKQSLPRSLHNTTENLQNHASEKTANQFLFLHIVYYQVLLFMNRFALPIPGSRPVLSKDMPEHFIVESAQTALEAANQISALIHEATAHLVVAPLAGYAAFFSSTVHIHGVFSKSPQLEASSKQNLAWNVKYLTKVKTYWGMFHFVTENLRDLYRRHADAARSGAKAGREGDQAIFQYGDWFDRYPHGVSGTDYEEPSLDVQKEPGADAVLGQKSDLQTVEEFFSKLSPPSRAAQMQQQQLTTRKAARKRQSKSEANRPSNIPQLLQDQSAGQAGQQDPHTQITHDLASTQTMQNNMGSFLQPSSGFPPGFQAMPNALAMNNVPQQFMSQLDRQMVLNSYNSQNVQPNLNNMMLDPSGHGLDNIDWSALAGNHSIQNSNGFWGDPSTAWFMPFNIDPPTFGDDGRMFNGNFDWNSFPGFDDLSNIAGPSMDANAGQDNLEGGGDQSQ